MWMRVLVVCICVVVLAGCRTRPFDEAAPDDGGSVALDAALDAAKACEANCPLGCCDLDGICETGLKDSACGAAGRSCRACRSVDSCVTLADGSGGSCVGFQHAPCNPMCSGCCQGMNTCIDLANISAQACGTGGETCSVCAPGDVCKGECAHPQPSCGPSNCAGCCIDGAYCAVGTNNNACGQAGQACQQCSDTARCQSRPSGGGHCGDGQSCGPLNCGGCCTDGECVPGYSTSLCGTK